MTAPHPAEAHSAERNEAARPALFAFDNSYARLPDRFHARLSPTPVRQPAVIRVNKALAEELGLDAARLAGPEGAAVLSGNVVPEGAEPLAQAYAGHQFGNWVHQLGDGRAIVLGEVIDRHGRRRDIQLKGSGRTPFSRMGDGRAPLGPVLREYIVSEAMAALGVPTTRALAAVATGEPVMREEPSPGAVLTRVAASHIRVGTFQYFYAREDAEAIRILADHVIARHYPQAGESDAPYAALLDAVIGAQARLIAQWMSLGFIHGVMNTDNMTVSGETIDYGPCAFMDAYHPQTVYSSIDAMGRYAYCNQPRIAHWNMSRLAQALLPVLGPENDETVAAAQAAIDTFPERFRAEWLARMRAKLGLSTAREEDEALIDDLLETMALGGADFTLTFRRLAEATDPDGGAAARALFSEPAAFDAWQARWRSRLALEQTPPAARRVAMRAVNPAFIPRNHLVEQAITAALGGDYSPFETLVDVLSRPFEDQPEHAGLARPPEPHEVVRQTFCGT